MKKKFYLWLLAFILVSLKLEAATMRVWVGQTFYCDVTSHFNNVYSQSNITWRSTIPHLYVVGGTYNRGMRVTQYFEGTASVTCEWIETAFPSIPSLTQTYKRKVTWTIKCESNPVSISPTQLDLTPGETAQLYYSHKYTNDYTSYANAYFYVGESDIVSVSDDGKVEALEEGVAHVYVYSYISGEHPYCKVNVSGKKPTSISLPDTITMKVGETQKITPQFTPEDTSSSLTWSTDNNYVAEISEDGVVTARNVGTATIKVVTANNLSASCILKVIKDPESINLTCTGNANDMFINDTIKFTAYVLPPGSASTYTWSSDSENIGTIIPSVENPKEALFIAKNAGDANITIKTENGISATRKITVKTYSTSEEIGLKIRKAQKVITEQILSIREKFLK